VPLLPYLTDVFDDHDQLLSLYTSGRSQGMKLLLCVCNNAPKIVPEFYSFYGTDAVYRCAVGHCTLSLSLSLSLFPLPFPPFSSLPPSSFSVYHLSLCWRDALVAERKSRWVSGFNIRWTLESATFRDEKVCGEDTYICHKRRNLSYYNLIVDFTYINLCSTN